MDMQGIGNSNANTSFIQTEALFWPLENILQKKVNGIALNILETFVDYIASFFDAYNQREIYLSSRVISIESEDESDVTEITHPVLKAKTISKQEDENKGILATVNESQIQANQTSRELVFDANGLSNLLMTTITPLRLAIQRRGIQDFKNIEIELKINESSYGVTIMTKEDNSNYNLADLMLLESKLKPFIDKIAEETSGAGDELSIHWDFILVDDKGKHTFTFRFKKTPHFEMVNGALFGSPGYGFESRDYQTLNLTF